MTEDFLRIINATYKILEFFPDNDPLKNKAKEKTLEILEGLTLISGIEGWSSLKKEIVSAKLIGDMEVLESYLKLARQQGFIDNVNLLILFREYGNIKDKIKLSKSPIRKDLEFVSSALNSGKRLVSEVNHFNGAKNEETLKIYSVRQTKILDMLSRKEKIQVSDIVKEIPNVTKRTIRRDLDNLLKIGKISRFGEFNQVFYKIGRTV